MNLSKLGWNKEFEKEYKKVKKDKYIPARVIREEKAHYLLQLENAICTSKISGKLRYNATSISELPSVGDWVLINLINNDSEAIIYSVFTRKSSFTRKASVSGGRKVKDINNRKITFGGATEEQVIAANIDIVFLVSALDDNYNLRRLERYLLMARNSGAKPVIVLNKSDKCSDLNKIKKEVSEIATGVPIHFVSAINNEGIEELKEYLNEGVTVALFGSSGVGKSTIINCFLEDNQKLLTGAIRGSDEKGRHTTTWRELLVLDKGGILIDTPGMRELQIWSDYDELDELFDDIKELESKCKFSDCTHKSEAACAIRKALESKELDPKRYENYLIMDIEVSYLNGRIKEKKKAYTKREILINKMNNKSKAYKY